MNSLLSLAGGFVGMCVVLVGVMSGVEFLVIPRPAATQTPEYQQLSREAAGLRFERDSLATENHDLRLRLDLLRRSGRLDAVPPGGPDGERIPAPAVPFPIPPRKD